MYGIYLIYNRNNLIYVGKTNNFQTRIRNHMSLQPWANEITHVETAVCKNKIDMDIYEKYYINKLNPKYNKAIVYNETPTFKIEQLKFTRFKLNEIVTNSEKLDLKNNNYKRCSIYEKRKNEIDEMLRNSTKINEYGKVDILNLEEHLFYWHNLSKNKITFLEIEGSKLLKACLNHIKKSKADLVGNIYTFKFKNAENMYRDPNKHTTQLIFSNYIISDKKIREDFTTIKVIDNVVYNMKTKEFTMCIDKSILDKYFIYKEVCCG